MPAVRNSTFVLTSILPLLGLYHRVPPSPHHFLGPSPIPLFFPLLNNQDHLPAFFSAILEDYNADGHIIAKASTRAIPADGRDSLIIPFEGLHDFVSDKILKPLKSRR